MKNISEIAALYKERLGLKYDPVGIYFEEKIPEGALSFKEKGNGCIAPLIFKAGTGKTVAVDFNTTGFPCSAFYLGYKEWIFPGIENFLSSGPFPGRECERLIESPEKAKEYIKTFIPVNLNEKVLVFKPILENALQKPEAVILFVNPDQLSALTYLAHFDEPEAEDRVVTRFASSCASIVTFPLRFAKEGKLCAFWGLQDISTRTSFPSDIFSFSLPARFFEKIGNEMENTFLVTERWEKVLNRIKKEASK
jgi:uncharacterized protein (DUF169 family)